MNISNLSGVAKVSFLGLSIAIIFTDFSPHFLKIMPLYALMYIVTILPLSAYRAASMAGRRWGLDAQLAAGFVFTLSGLVNCVIYATTRNIISSESVGAIRRGSTSATVSGLGPSESIFSPPSFDSELIISRFQLNGKAGSRTSSSLTDQVGVLLRRITP
jgi:hypothetical protein